MPLQTKATPEAEQARYGAGKTKNKVSWKH